jgi:hypothetical protein
VTECKQITGVPFEYKSDDGAPIRARLCLLQPREHGVIPVAASPGIDPDVLQMAWVVALNELAHLFTGIREDEPVRLPPDKSGGTHLRVVSDAFVRPYVRRLKPGQHASEVAITNASLHGVELRDGQTYVTDHIRHGKGGPLRVNGGKPSIRLDELDAPEARAA